MYTIKTLVLFIIVILSRNSSVHIYIFMYHICKYMKINVLLPISIIIFYIFHPRKEYVHYQFRITCA